MSVELTNGEIFLHLPKTGGIFITKALRELGLVKRRVGGVHWDVTRVVYRERLAFGRDVIKHFLWKRLSPSYRGTCDGHNLMFVFVRCPFSWYESYWRFMMGRERADWGAAFRASREPPHNWWAGSLGPLDALMDKSFDGFLRKVLRYRPGFVTELFGMYDQYPVQFVGKQETLTRDLSRFLLSRGYDVPQERLDAMSRRNVTAVEIAAPAWSDELRMKIALTELAGFVRYGYFHDLPEAVRSLHPALVDLDYGGDGCPTIAGYGAELGSYVSDTVKESG